MTYKVIVGVDGSPHGATALRWALADAASMPARSPQYWLRSRTPAVRSCWSSATALRHPRFDRAGKDAVLVT
jgi:hypothetical protein